ncbi:MAG: class I SAM-dependent methyltransferase [Pseudomonadota bacterium]
MKSYEYKTLFDLETSYWWFRGLHAILRDTLPRVGLKPDAIVLDAGCGTGQNMINLMDNVGYQTYGFDISAHAASFWPKRGLKGVCLGSINDIPFKDETFDGVISVDVLECEAVIENQAYREMWRVLRPGGILALVLPAYDWLLSEEHHKAVMATRRYSRKKVLDLLNIMPVRLVRLTNLFAALFPLVATYRILQPYWKQRSSDEPRSEIKSLPSPLNETLFRIVDLEKNLLRRIDFPFGSSILAIARKAA